MIKAKVIGACGYGGVGIVELLTGHPNAEISMLTDIENVGIPISELYPHLKGICDLPISDSSELETQEKVDIVFMATPDRVGMRIAPGEISKGAKVIDYSGDFRFNTQSSYSDYAAKIGKPTEHTSHELLKDAVYGLPELHRNEITPRTKVIGNPGCFAVSCILGLAPAVQQHLIKPQSIICDCKSGVSGAGKKAQPTFHYPARYDNMNAYKLSGHQHTCEIERELSLISGAEIKITFTAQLIPICRGIMSTLYGDLESGIKEKEVFEIYSSYFKNEPFIRLLDGSSQAGSIHVRGTNYCNLLISVDHRTNRLRVVSYIDNLMKGQAGSALQNMNILFGIKETTGLLQTPKYP